MITLDRIDNTKITVNCDLILSVSTSHDSTITMLNGNKIVVKDSYEQIIEKTIEYKRKCNSEINIKEK